MFRMFLGRQKNRYKTTNIGPKGLITYSLQIPLVVLLHSLSISIAEIGSPCLFSVVVEFDLKLEVQFLRLKFADVRLSVSISKN